jgi:predicted dehydrogenase
VAGLQFVSGAFITLTTSFDVWKHQGQHIELFGETGSMVLPDPNNFGGKIFTCLQDGDWQEQVSNKPFASNVRGLGVADLAEAIQSKTAHRADGEMALHVLEIMENILLACEDGQERSMSTTCTRPAPLVRNQHKENTEKASAR